MPREQYHLPPGKRIEVSEKACLPNTVQFAGGASAEALLEVYRRLFASYGPQHWWPAESRLEIVLGAILTQATAWRGVEKALANLKTGGLLSTQALRDTPEEQLASFLVPAGYFNAKARKVKAFINHLWDNYGGDLDLFLSGKPQG